MTGRRRWDTSHVGHGLRASRQVLRVPVKGQCVQVLMTSVPYQCVQVLVTRVPYSSRELGTAL